jgi:hypothetical protein
VTNDLGALPLREISLFDRRILKGTFEPYTSGQLAHFLKTALSSTRTQECIFVIHHTAQHLNFNI